MVSTISAKRKNDAVLAVCQDNKGKLIRIEGANSVMEQITGYSAADLQGQDLKSILPDDIKDLINSYVEFDEGGNDLAAVLRKVMNFRILAKNGDPMDVLLKVFYVVSSDAMHPRYELLIRDVTILRKIAELKESLSTINIDMNTDFDAMKVSKISENTVDADLEKIYQFSAENSFPVSFGFIKFDQYEECKNKYGEDSASQVKMKIIKAIAETIREKDLVGILMDGYICIALFDCTAVDAKGVFGRIRSAVSKKQISFQESVDADAKPVSLGIRFTELDKKFTMTQIRKSLIDALDKSDSDNIDNVSL